MNLNLFLLFFINLWFLIFGISYRCENHQVLIVQSFGNDKIRMHCQKLDLCGNRNLQCNYDYEQPSCGGKNNFVAHVHQVTPTGPVQHTCCELQKSENKNIFGHDGNDCFVYELPDGSHSTTNSDYHKRKIHSVDPNEEFTVLNNIGQIPEQFDGYVGYRMKLFMLRNKSPPSLIVKAIERLPEGYRVTICRPRCGNFHREDSIGIHEKSENSPKTISGDIMHGKVQSPAEWTAASWSSWSSSSWSTWSTTKLIGENEEKNNKRGNIRGDRLKIDENDKTGQEIVNNVNVQATGGNGGNGGQGFGGNANGGGTGNGVSVANASGAGIRVGVGEKSNGNGKDKNDEIDDKLGKTKPENPDSSVKSPKDDLNEKNKNGDRNGKNNGEDENGGNGKGNGKNSGDGKDDGNGKSEIGTGDENGNGTENGKNKNDGNSGDGIDSERNGNGSGNGKSGERGDKMTTIIEPDGSGQAVNKGDEEDKAKGNKNGEGDGNGSGNGKDGESDGKRNGKNETSIVGEANSSGNDNGDGTKVITGPSHLSSEKTSEGDNSDKNKGSKTGNNFGNNNGEANLTGAGSDGNGGKFITDPSHLSSEKVDEGEGDGKNNGNSGNGNDNNKGDETKNDLGDNNSKANLVGDGGDDQAEKASSAENAAEELTRINEEDKNGNSGDNKGSDGSSDKLKESAESNGQGIPARNDAETSTTTTTSSPVTSMGSVSGSAAAAASDTTGTASAAAAASGSATGTQASSSSGNAGMNCFSSDMEVATISGTKRMDQLEIGDLILVPASGNLLKYEKVEMFYHREPETIAKFVEIKTENGRTLSLTALHLLPFGDCAEFSGAEFDMENIEALMRQSRFAYKIKKDECIVSVNANGKLIADKVIFVGRRISKGIYSPMTVEGSLIANNVLASCFSQIESHTIQKLAYDALFGIYNLFGFMKDAVTEPTQEIPSMLNYIHQLSRHVLPFSKY